MGHSLELVTVDLGNSSCKARLWRLDGALERVAGWEAPSRAGLGAELAEWLARSGRDVAAGYCSVAARELTAEVERALGERCARGLEAGLIVDYRTPETLGADRLFAARGAVEALGESCIVVDAGTAVTVDALALRDDGARIFLGGAIAPGPALLARALHLGTAHLPEVAPRPDEPALGKDTRGALAGGLVHGFRGLVEGLVTAVAREAGLESAPVALGGGASSLLGPSPCPGRRVLRLEDLVHLGLVAALRQRLAEPQR